MFELNRRIIINYRVTNVAPDLDLDYNAVHRNWPIRTIINSQLWTGLWLALSRVVPDQGAPLPEKTTYCWKISLRPINAI